MATIEYKPRWYFGGISAAGGVCVTHPLDLTKVLLQTNTQKKPINIILKEVIQNNGISGLYNGLSASIFRQLTYSTARFAIYDAGKTYINNDSLFQKMALAGFSGTIGGFIGVPSDVVNVRLQNDVALPAEQRRNYKHVFDGLIKIYRDEGISGSFRGASTASVRGGVMTVGQLAFYDQIKLFLVKSNFQDNPSTHIIASISAAAIATLMAQPLDVLKTRTMNAKPGEGFLDVFKYTLKSGPLGFFSGILPAFIRVCPLTVLMFLFYEQLRLNFGIPVIK